MNKISKIQQDKKLYELTYIISDSLDEKKAISMAEKIKQLLPNGQIKSENFWGRRKLAYPIKKREFGYYVTLVFETEPSKIEALESKLKAEEDVIRYLIVKTKPQAIQAPKEPTKKAKEKETSKEISLKKTKTQTKTAESTKITKEKKEKEVKETESEDKKMKKLEEKLKEILKE